ncbi:hypothetical protein [Methylotenera sp.]|uniref:hypothetical protein n=1 Tax=Methylotenera sp. TaxID=2051956 RepID=UPI00248961D1|nr:hypothetical protein [Methylotenera sp.]MDI1299551.1 hypothetical protein [Methylotenera sp.]
MMHIKQPEIKHNHRVRSITKLASTLVLLATITQTFNAVAEQFFTVTKPLIFKEGNAKLKTVLSKIEDARDVMEGRYLVGSADLNDDGRVEIILQSSDSMNCGSGGCLTVVIEQPVATSTKTYTLLSQNLGSSLSVTNEKVGNYRALAGLMQDGSIQVADKKGTPLYGKQMVYAMNNASAPVDTAKTEIVAPAANSSASQTNNSATDKSAPSIAGISLGMTAAEAKRIMTAHFKSYNNQSDPVSELAFTGAISTKTAPFVWQLIAETPTYNSASKTIQSDRLDVSLSPPPDARVVKVKRLIRFAVGNEVDVSNLHDQLNSKYGVANNTTGRSLWFFDSKGNLIKAPSAIKAEGNCKVIDAHSKFNNIFNNINVYKKGQPIFGLNPACGSVLEMDPASNLKGPTTVVTTALIDNNGFLNAIVDGFAYLSGQSDAAANQDATKAKSRAVPNL